MKFKKVVATVGMVQGLALLGLSTARADVILSYTGNVFTDFIAPYTGTDKVTASITLANPLGDNLNNAQVIPLGFSLSDGVQTITNNISMGHRLDAPRRDPGGGPLSYFSFTTDSNGEITNWEVLADTPVSLNPPSFDLRSIETLNLMDITSDAGRLSIMFQEAPRASNQNQPGIWTTAAVPAPPLSNLAALGVLGLAFLWRRRRQIFGLGQ